MFTVTIVRHGETKCNVGHIVQSRTPGELTERGIKMADTLGKHLRNETFTRVYSSDLKRCHDTTLHILKQSVNKQPEVTLDPALRERDFGDLEFKSVSLSHDIKKETGLPIHQIPIPGGEPYEDAVKRTAKFFSALCKLADATTAHENVLVVSHGCLILCLLDYLDANRSVFELENWDSARSRICPRNTGTTKLIIHKKEGTSNEADKRRLEFFHFHDDSHLVAENI